MNTAGRRWLSIVPVLVVMLVMTFGTLLFAVAQSLGYAPQYGINHFPTLSYYQQLFLLPEVMVSLGLSLYYAMVATGLALILGFLLALALLRVGRDQQWLHYAYKLPLMVPYLVAIALVIVLFGQGGLIARFSYALGWIDTPAEFANILYNHYGWGIILVYLWKQVPFMALSIYVVLLGIPVQTHDAATLLGANRWQRWIHVVLPQVMPGVLSATLICFAFNVGAFEAPFILGGGFPDTLPVLAWRLFTDPDYTQRLTGMAALVLMGLLLLVSVGLATAVGRRSARRQRGLI